MLEVANAAVHEPRRSARGTTCEVVPLNQSGAEAAERGIAGDSGSGDAAADDQQVERFGAESVDLLGAPASAGERGEGHARKIAPRLLSAYYSGL